MLSNTSVLPLPALAALQRNSRSYPISGLIKTEQNGLDISNQRLTGQITNLNTRLSLMQTALNRQLQMADAAVAALQTQQQVLTASIQSVNLAMYGKNFGSASGG